MVIDKTNEIVRNQSTSRTTENTTFCNTYLLDLCSNIRMYITTRIAKQNTRMVSSLSFGWSEIGTQKMKDFLSSKSRTHNMTDSSGHIKSEIYARMISIGDRK